MRRIDDRRELAHAIHAEVRDRRRSALVFVRLELARPCALGKLTHLGGNRGERFLLGLPDHRRDQPALDRDRDADVGMLEAQDAVFGPHRIGRRHALQRHRPHLDDEIVDREPIGWRAVLALGRSGVGVLAQRQQPADIDVGGEIEMRDGLLGLHQPRGDGLAHAVERHFLERHVTIERDHLGGRWAARHGARARARLRSGGRLDVARDDAPVRTGRRDTAEVNAGFGCKASRQAASPRCRRCGPGRNCARACALRRTDRAE